MTAYIIVGLTPKDTEKLAEYGAKVPNTLTKFSGEVLHKGPVEKLQGNFNYKLQVILMFPSRKHAHNWYHSKAYQALLPTRDLAMDCQFQLVG